jgi:methionyl aminopeptidase
MEEPEDNLDEFREVGRIGAGVREESRKLVMVGTPLLDVAETIEGMIADEGCTPAFPVNISINEIAAHYTPETGSEAVLDEKDVVKIDIGLSLNGAIADTAYTIDLSGEHKKLVEASEKALENAIAAMKPGTKIGEIGGIIEETISSYNFKPISNLTGHKIKTGVLHAGVEVPNVKSEDPYEFKAGEIFAVEPFATNGAGYVEDQEQVEIFSLYAPAPVRMRQSRKIIEYVINEYGGLPFAERWIRKKFPSRLLVSAALKELLESHFIKGYPVLREAEKGLVSQTEHTILITEEGNEVLTK